MRKPRPPTADTSEFLQFWSVYPRADGKGAARLAFNRALNKASFTAIMAGLQAYPFSADIKYIPLPATWLNQERWIGVVVREPPTKIAPPPRRGAWRDAYDRGPMTGPTGPGGSWLRYGAGASPGPGPTGSTGPIIEGDCSSDE
jgi:hypothetical protein